MPKMADFTGLKIDNKIPVGRLRGIAPQLFGHWGNRPHGLCHQLHSITELT